MLSLHSLLSAELSSLEQITYNKSSMVAVSHALEELVLEFNLQAEMFVTFQRFEFFLAEKERYLKLDNQGCKLFIFCSQLDRSQLTEFERATFLEIEADNPLQKEWDVIVNHPHHPMLLLTKERKDLQQRVGDDFRVFSGILSFEPRIMNKVIEKLEVVLNKFAIDYQPTRYNFEQSSNQHSEFNQKLSIFLNQALSELEKKNDNLLQVVREKATQEAELKKARQLHQQFLPTKLPTIDGLSIASYYQPARHLGGDFYNLVPLEDYLIFYIVDITGHGLDGALLNIFIRDTINNFLLTRKDKIAEISPADILKFVGRRYRQEDFPEDYFVCLALGKIKLTTGEVHYANAGIHVPAIIDRGEKTDLITNSQLPISAVIEPQLIDYQVEHFTLKSGDKLVLTTDGLIELKNQTGRYGAKRFEQLITANSEVGCQELIEKINQDVNRFCETREIKDDLTIVIIEKN